MRELASLAIFLWFVAVVAQTHKYEQCKVKSDKSCEEFRNK